MHHNVADYLNAWENFYIIVGSSAGALTGLQFDRDRIDRRGSPTEQWRRNFGVRHANGSPLLRRLAPGRDSERTMGCTFECGSCPRCLRPNRPELLRDRGKARAGSEGVCTNDGGLGFSCRPAASFVCGAIDRGYRLPAQPPISTLRGRCSSAHAFVHRNPQRMGHRHLYCRTGTDGRTLFRRQSARGRLTLWGRSHSSRARWTRATAIDPSPTADATRFRLPLRTSPTANTPCRLVSSRYGIRARGQ